MGFLVTTEPRFYCGRYRDGREHRPDITVSANEFPTTVTFIPVATDIVISAQQDIVGKAAEMAAELKRRDHAEAVASLHHEFHPLSLEVHEHRDKSVNQWINSLIKYVPPSLQYPFRLEVHSTIANALAKARVATILARKAEYRTSF